MYNNNGNIASKGDVAGGAYSYDSNKIHAVVGIANPDYSQLSMYNQHVTYTSFQQPHTITEHDQTATLTYGHDHQRLKGVYSNAGGTTMRYYLGDYEVVDDGTTTTQLHYIAVGMGLHMVIAREGGVDTYYRTYSDYQGSVLQLENFSGPGLTRYNYDAWGRRRSIPAWDYNYTASGPAWFNRGYTGHEHLDDYQLINMNGRLYDPVVGRMLSVDNYVQLPHNSQGYNRYSYALNNPTRYTDPSGELIPQLLLGAAIGVIMNGVSNSIQHKAFFSGAGRAAAFGAISGAVSGGIGFIADASLQAGSSAVSVAAWQVAAHSWSGAMFSILNGSDPLSGAAAGGVSSLVSSSIGSAVTSGNSQLGAGGSAIMIAGGGLSGGIGALLTGGNFWQGASHGLMVAGLNHVAHGLVAKDLEYSTETAKRVFAEEYGDLPSYTDITADGSLPPPDADFHTFAIVKSKGVWLKAESNSPITGYTYDKGDGTSHIYLSSFTFNNRNRLAFTLGHEYYHARLLHAGIRGAARHHAAIAFWQAARGYYKRDSNKLSSGRRGFNILFNYFRGSDLQYMPSIR